MVLLYHKIAMEQKQTLNNRIVELQKKVMDLKKVLAEDQFSSFREAVQTTEMIQTYERQVCNLREEIANADFGMCQYDLKCDDETISFFLVEFGADPFKKWISKASPLGQQLMHAKVGSSVTLANKEYQVINIKTIS